MRESDKAAATYASRGRRRSSALRSTVAVVIAVAPAAAWSAPAGGGRVSPYPSVDRLYGPQRTLAVSIEPPVLVAASIGDLERVQRWSDAIAREVPAVLAAGSDTRQGYERIMAALYEWAGASALEGVRGAQARSLVPRRLIGAVMGYIAAKPIADATGDIRRDAIERWIGEQARRTRATFGTGGSGDGVLDYNNSLQATAATMVMAAHIVTGDPTFRTWAVQSTREVLDEIDAEGFTGEVTNTAPARAEQRSHEVMIYVVGTATMAAANGDASLWSYPGRSGTGGPAILRAGLLLGTEMNANYVTKRYAVRTGTTQAAFPGVSVVDPERGGVVAPAGWLTCWIAPFVAQYGDRHAAAPGMRRLMRAQQWYRGHRASQFNGALPLIGDVALPSRIETGAKAVFMDKNQNGS